MRRSILFFVLVLLTSCVGQKKVVKKAQSKETVKQVFVKKDSVKTIDRNLAINDKILLSLKTNDKKIDSIIRLRLKGFETQKISGKNYYKATFDYEKLALSIATVLGETKNTNIKKNTESKADTTNTSTDTEYFYKKIKVVPWWLWVFLAVVFLPQIISRLELIINPLKAFFKK